MTDLVKRLRDVARQNMTFHRISTGFVKECAAEIERLNAIVLKETDRVHVAWRERDALRAEKDGWIADVKRWQAMHQRAAVERDAHKALVHEAAKLLIAREAELAEAKREIERMDGMHRAFDAKYIAWLAERDALRAELAETQLLTTRDDYAALEAERDAALARERGLRARVEQLELAAHLAAADFEEARRVASLCLENIRSVVPDPRAALAASVDGGAK